GGTAGQPVDHLQRDSLVAPGAGVPERLGPVRGTPRPRLVLLVLTLGVGAHVGVVAHAQHHRVGGPRVVHVTGGERLRNPGEQFLVQAQHVRAPARAGPRYRLHVVPGLAEVVHVLGRYGAEPADAGRVERGGPVVESLQVLVPRQQRTDPFPAA